jgi:nicotinate-nucleotide adenylyltransferase
MKELAEGVRRIAFFGGSFDPPHLGHLAVARAARAALGLDGVLFAPVGAQPLKPRGSTAPFADRLAMTELAIAGDAGFVISLADAPSSSGSPNYTLDTLLKLRSQLPATGALFCLMGADSFLGLRRWHRAKEIPFAAALIVASRPKQRLDDLTAALPAGVTIEPAAEAGLPSSDVDLRAYQVRNAEGETAPFYLLSGLHIDISATEIRKEVRAGAGDVLLPAAVADYIRSRGLYR